MPVVDIGSAKKTNWVPAELCDIGPGQPYRGKLNDKETAQMIRYACNPPKVNAEAIVHQGFPTLGLAPVAGPINGFGLSIDTEMAVIPARELRPPRLTYRAGNANIRDGSWNILDVKFHRGARVSSWWVMVVRDGTGIITGPKDTNFVNLVTGFTNKCKNSGISMPDGLPRLLPPVVLPHPNSHPTRANAIDMIRNTIKTSLTDKGGQKPSFILVLLENRDNYIYPGIKVCNVSVGF